MRNLKIAYNKLEKLKQEASKWDHDIRPCEVSRRFNREFESLSVRFQFDGIDTYLSAGEYDPDREDSTDPKYRVFLGFNKEHRIWFWVNTDELYDEIFLILAHEFRHGYQHRICGYKVGWYKHDYAAKTQSLYDYYTHPNELDAYAYETAMAIRLQQIRPDVHERVKWIVDAYKKHVLSQSSKMYNKFLRRMIKYLD